MSAGFGAALRMLRTSFEEASIAGPRRVLSRLVGHGDHLEPPTLPLAVPFRALDVPFGWPSLITSVDPSYSSFVVSDGSGRAVELGDPAVLAVNEAPFDVLLAGLDFIGHLLDEDPVAVDGESALRLLRRPAPGDCAYSRAHRLLVLMYLYANSLSTPTNITALVRTLLEKPLVESHLGGNHLLRELRAAATVAAVTGSDDLESWLRKFFDEVLDQFSADGGHLERSAFYHLQALSDLRATMCISQVAGREVPTEILEAERLASRVLEFCTTPDGRVLGFHDSWRVRSPAKHPSSDHETLFGDFGLFIARRSRWTVYLDCGSSSPRFPVGHLHGSNLGTEIWMDETPIVIDPGVTTYSAGARRSYERSDNSHNGPRSAYSRRLHSRGSFRTGRPASGGVSDVTVAPSCVEVTANSESRLGPAAERTITLASEGVTIVDKCNGGTRIVLNTGGNELEQLSPGCWRIGRARISFDKWRVTAETTEFGPLLRAETSHSVAQLMVTSLL